MEQWIKWEKGLVNKPEVGQIARATGCSRLETAARLMLVWEWFDGATEDGNVSGCGAEDVDQVAGMVGFAEAMANTVPVAWLHLGPHGLSVPKFSRHNGKSAKARAQHNRRMSDYRERTK